MVVERQLAEEGKHATILDEKISSRGYGVEGRIGGIIIGQLRRLGASVIGIANVSLWMRGYP